jgi:signal peptidase II
MGSDTQGGGVGRVNATGAAQRKAAHSCAWGPSSAFGLGVAGLTCAADQAAKFWLLYGLHLGQGARIQVTRFIELVLTWNTGISYGLFPQQGPVGSWALFAFKVAAVVFLWAWLACSSARLTGLSLGLIIGGAIGNAIDRLHWPGVMDFVLLHVNTASFSFSWYVFNLADVAIVAGVLGLLYESLRPAGAAKAP